MLKFDAREVIVNNEWRRQTELTIEFAAIRLFDKVSTDLVIPNDPTFTKTVTSDADQLESKSQTPEVLAIMLTSPETTKIVEGGKNSPIKETEEEQEETARLAKMTTTSTSEVNPLQAVPSPRQRRPPLGMTLVSEEMQLD